MTDVEYTHLQNEILKMWKDDEDKMLKKLQELNQQYIKENNICNKKKSSIIGETHERDCLSF